MATKTQYYNLDKPSYDDVADIEIINANMDKIDTQMRNNADGVNFAKGISSDAYDNSKSYAVGDYCIYDNKLYRCITAIESAEAFNIAKWEQTTVGKEVEQLNSNLVELEFGENSGGKNILDITQNYKRYSNGVLSVSGNKVTVTGQWYCYYIIDVEENTDYFISGNVDSHTVNNNVAIYNEDVSEKIIESYALNSTFNSGNNSKIAVILYSGTYEDGTTVFSNLMVEEGTQGTDYEPYIPSVKMLADEVNAQNDSLEDYGLDNKSSDDWKQGYYDENLNVASSNGHLCIGTYPCNSGDLINIKTSKDYKQITIRYNNGSIGGDGTIGTPHNKISVTVPSGATSFGIYVGNDVPITTSDGGHISVYVNNAIEQIKNDLDKLGSKIEFGNVDFNSLTSSMVYAINGTCTNAPKTDAIHGVLMVFIASNGIISQLYHDSDGTLYKRMCWGGTWSNWS